MLIWNTRTRVIKMLQEWKTIKEIQDSFKKAIVKNSDIINLKKTSWKLNAFLVDKEPHRICKHCSNTKKYPEKFHVGFVCKYCYNLKRRNNIILWIWVESARKSRIKYSRKNRAKINEKNLVKNLTLSQLKNKRRRDRLAKQRQRELLKQIQLGGLNNLANNIKICE